MLYRCLSLPHGWALAVGLAFASLSSLVAANDQPNDRAAAANEDLLIPEVLSPGDISAYQKIFALQESGSWPKADRHIRSVKNDVLMGHVLYQRYMHPTKYRSKFVELRDWMKRYADHPGANRVYRLAAHRRPKNARRPKSPTPLYYESQAVVQKKRPAKARLTRGERDRRKYESKIRSKIRYYLRIRRPDRAEKRLWAAENLGLFDDLAFDTQLSRIASRYFYLGNTEKAAALGNIASTRSGDALPEAAWIAGLGAWRLGDFARAAQHFEAVGNSSESGPWLGSAGSYWAARAHLKSHAPDKVLAMLNKAARNPRTFYGSIAARQLGHRAPFNWDRPALDKAQLAQIKSYPGITRAIALKQAGREDHGDREYRWTSRRLPPSERDALLRGATALDFPASQATLARQTLRYKGTAVDAALYPVPSWTPSDGFRMDRAILYAFIRQESNFMQHAKSSAGARGVMQLMPRTASYIARDRSLRGSRRNRLFDPNFNMFLGQKYLLYLLDKKTTRDNLFLVATAYNAGPGNLAKWLRAIDHREDWLMFIESLPKRETRNYVERVMANLWAYRSRFGQASPSLDAIARGAWPSYTSLDAAPFAAASTGGQ